MLKFCIIGALLMVTAKFIRTFTDTFLIPLTLYWLAVFPGSFLFSNSFGWKSIWIYLLSIAGGYFLGLVLSRITDHIAGGSTMKTSKRMVIILGSVIAIAAIVLYFSIQSYDTKNSELKKQLTEANQEIDKLEFYEDYMKLEENLLEQYKNIFCHHLKKEDLVLIDVYSKRNYYHDAHVAEYCRFIPDFQTDYFRVESRTKMEDDFFGYEPCPDCRDNLKEYYPNHE